MVKPPQTATGFDKEDAVVLASLFVCNHPCASAAAATALILCNARWSVPVGTPPPPPQSSQPQPLSTRTACGWRDGPPYGARVRRARRTLPARRRYVGRRHAPRRRYDAGRARRRRWPAVAHTRATHAVPLGRGGKLGPRTKGWRLPENGKGGSPSPPARGRHPGQPANSTSWSPREARAIPHVAPTSCAPPLTLPRAGGVERAGSGGAHSRHPLSPQSPSEPSNTHSGDLPCGLAPCTQYVLGIHTSISDSTGRKGGAVSCLPLRIPYHTSVPIPHPIE